jgi:hypothetical protein
LVGSDNSDHDQLFVANRANNHLNRPVVAIAARYTPPDFISSDSLNLDDCASPHDALSFKKRDISLFRSLTSMGHLPANTHSLHYEGMKPEGRFSVLQRASHD